MKKELSTRFSSRQYMKDGDFEIFYYNDNTPAHVSSHHHNYYECYFFLEGDVDYEIDSISYHLKCGDFLLIPPGISHQPLFFDSRIPYGRFVLWISEEFYQSLCASCPDYSYAFDHANKERQYHYHSDFIQSQELQGQLMDLIEESRGSRVFQEASSRLMLCRFLLQINRLLHEQIHLTAPAYSNVLYLNVCDYINNHLEEDLSLDRLASFFYVSKYHIAHVFKEHMGISLHQYIIKKRLHACKNAILTGLLVGDLFHQYGFRDYSSFYRAFKKQYGLSPREFREQHARLEEYSHPFV